MSCSYGFSSLTVEEMSVKRCSSNTLCYNMTRCEKNVIRPISILTPTPTTILQVKCDTPCFVMASQSAWTQAMEALPTDNRVRTFPVWPLFPASYLFHFSPPNSYHPDSLSGQKLSLFTSLMGKILKPHFVRNFNFNVYPVIFYYRNLT